MMLKVIEAVKYNSFKEKMQLMKKYQNKTTKIQDLGGFLYIEKSIAEI